jgi:hypothetical protein
MIERNLLDQTKDLRPPQRLVRENFNLEERMAQNNRVGGMQRRNDAQPIRGNNPPVFDRRAVFDVSGPIRARGGGSMVMRPVPPDQMQDNNPSQTYQNQENRSFSNSYGNSYGNSMSGYQPQYGSRGGFGMQQPMYGGGMGIMGLQSPFGGYGMQSPFGSYGGGMQQPMYGGGMQSPRIWYATTYVWRYAARIWNAVSIRWIWNATASVPEQPI